MLWSAAMSSDTLADPAVVRDPYPYFARLRADDPVHFDEGIKTWLVTRYDDLVTVARDTDTYSTK
jgi:cytochrome P450